MAEWLHVVWPVAAATRDEPRQAKPGENLERLHLLWLGTQEVVIQRHRTQRRVHLPGLAQRHRELFSLLRPAD
jgi:hypothetical protein